MRHFLVAGGGRAAGVRAMEWADHTHSPISKSALDTLTF